MRDWQHENAYIHKHFHVLYTVTNNSIKEGIAFDTIPRAAEALMLLSEATGLEIVQMQTLFSLIQKCQGQHSCYFKTYFYKYHFNVSSISFEITILVHTYLNKCMHPLNRAFVLMCGRFENTVFKNHSQFLKQKSLFRFQIILFLYDILEMEFS